MAITAVTKWDPMLFVDMAKGDTDQIIAVGRPFLFKRAHRIPWRALTRQRQKCCAGIS